MTDEITQKYLDSARIRGVPSSIPGASGLIGSYDFEVITRQTLRALAIDLEGDFTVAQLREAHETLQSKAKSQKLRVLEEALVALNGDPMEDPPHEWTWQLVLPVRGRAKAEDDVKVERVHGGSFVETGTSKGFPDLYNLYTYFLGEFLPLRKQELSMPRIYHRVVEGLDNDDPAQVALAVFIPFGLSLRPPQRLLSRSLM